MEPKEKKQKVERIIIDPNITDDGIHDLLNALRKSRGMKELTPEEDDKLSEEYKKQRTEDGLPNYDD